MTTIRHYLDYRGPDENPPGKSEANSLRVLTWNLHYWTDNEESPTFDRIVDSIHAIDADIVFLQEVVVGRGQFPQDDDSDEEGGEKEDISLCPHQSLEDTFPSYTPVCARAAGFYAEKHWIDKKGKRRSDGGFGNAVLIHKRLGGVKDQECLELLPRYSGGERRTAAIATLRDPWNGLSLAVASCHLDVWGPLSTRYGQAAHVAKHLQNKYPNEVLIVGGDFNAPGLIGESMPGFQRVQLTAAAAGIEVGFADHNAIDHIFYQGYAKPVDCVAIGNFASDHVPVVAHFVASQQSAGNPVSAERPLRVVVSDAQGKEKLLTLSHRSTKEILAMAKLRLNLRKRPSSVSDVSGQIVNDERLLYFGDGVKLVVA